MVKAQENGHLIITQVQNLLTIYGNVKTESIKGIISADNIEIDISKRTVDLSMFGNGEVKVKIRN